MSYDDSGIGGDTAGHGVAGDVGMGMADSGGGYGGGYDGGGVSAGDLQLGGSSWDSFGSWADAAFGRDSLAQGIGGDPAQHGSGWSGMGRNPGAGIDWGNLGSRALGGLGGFMLGGPLGMMLGASAAGGLHGYNTGSMSGPEAIGGFIGSGAGAPLGMLGSLAGQYAGRGIGGYGANMIANAVPQGLMGPEPTLLAESTPARVGFMDYTTSPRAGGLY
jgi:hypothetical protein